MATKATEYKARARVYFKLTPGARKKAMANRIERAQGQVAAQQESRPRTLGKGHFGMTTRSRRETITFQHPFRIRDIDRLLPAGTYEVITDEEMIEGLSFPAFRRVATMIMVPALAPISAMEMVSIGSVDLSDARRLDASAPHE
jgi:hypothetical protein